MMMADVPQFLRPQAYLSTALSSFYRESSHSGVKYESAFG
jgi:hypothetical protein